MSNQSFFNSSDQFIACLCLCVIFYFSHNIDTHCVDTGNNLVNMSRVSVSCFMSNLWPVLGSDLQAVALNLN